MLVRRIARPLFAAWFVAEGVDALRRPEPHVTRTEEAWRSLKDRLDLPEQPSTSQLTTLAKVHGAAMAGAGLMLALGKAPRTAALALAALTAPLALVNQPFTSSGDAGDADAKRDRFVRNLSMLGGALLAGLDREGRPGLAWRTSHAYADLVTAREAKAALAAANKETRAAVAAATKEAKTFAKEARASAKAARHAA